MKSPIAFMLSLAVASFVPVLHAQTLLTVNGLVADAEVTENGTIANSGEIARAGVSGGSAGTNGRNGIFVFQLPETLTAADVVNVSFSATLKTITGWYSPGGMHFGVDLYALDARSTSTVLASDYYYGAPVDSRAGVTLIQQNFYPSGQPQVSDLSLSTGSTADAALTSFVKSLLDAGKAGDYIFLRVNPNAGTSYVHTRGYDFYTANAANTDFRPYLEISTIPEPAAFASLIGLGALALGLIRRKGR